MKDKHVVTWGALVMSRGRPLANPTNAQGILMATLVSTHDPELAL